MLQSQSWYTYVSLSLKELMSESPCLSVTPFHVLSVTTCALKSLSKTIDSVDVNSAEVKDFSCQSFSSDTLQGKSSE